MTRILILFWGWFLSGTESFSNLTTDFLIQSDMKEKERATLERVGDSKQIVKDFQDETRRTRTFRNAAVIKEGGCPKNPRQSKKKSETEQNVYAVDALVACHSNTKFALFFQRPHHSDGYNDVEGDYNYHRNNESTQQYKFVNNPTTNRIKRL